MDIEALKTLSKSMKADESAIPEAITDEVVENSSLTEENNDSNEETPQSTEEEETPIQESDSTSSEESTDDNQASDTTTDWKSYAKENGYISKEDFEDAKLEWEDEYKPATAEHSDYIKKMIELESKGHKVDDSSFWKFQAEDFNKTAEIAINDKSVGFDMLADAMQINDPEAPHGELMRELSLKYADLISGDYDKDDREYQKAELEYNRDIRNAKNSLNKLKNELALPVNESIAESAQAKEREEKLQAARPKAERQFKRRVDTFIENNKSYGFKYNGEDFEYSLSKKDIALVKENLKSIFENVPSLVTENGLNDSLIKEDAFIKRREELMWNTPEIRDILISKATEKVAAQKLEEDVKQRKNIQPPKSSGTTLNKEVESDLAKIGKQARSKRYAGFR